MVTVIYAAGSWGTIANVLFVLSAVFSDVLLIRGCLVLGFGFLIISAALGLPDPPNWGPTGIVAAGIIAWSALSGLLHLQAFLQLCIDERKIKFKSEDEEQLWRLFYRRSGMQRLEFQQSLRLGEWMSVKAGESIVDEETEGVCLHVVVSGVARITFQDDSECPVSRICSGDLFEISLGNLFGVYIGFPSFLKSVTAETDMLMFKWTVMALEHLATQAPPAVSCYWRNMFMYQVASVFNWRVVMKGQSPLYYSTGEKEPMEWLKGARSRDFVDPLRPDEIQQTTPMSILQFIWQSMDIRLPPGMRHMSLPPTGSAARCRVLVNAHYVACSGKELSGNRVGLRHVIAKTKKGLVQLSQYSRLGAAEEERDEV